MNSPRNVIAIDRIPVSSIIGFQRTGVNSVKMDANSPWQSLVINVPARLTISDKIENGVRLYIHNAMGHVFEWGQLNKEQLDELVKRLQFQRSQLINRDNNQEHFS